MKATGRAGVSGGQKLCLIKGAGGVLGRFSLFNFFLLRRMAVTRNFFRNGKILFLAKVIEFSNHENTYNYIARTNFNRDSPKINFINYLLLPFFTINA